jgi:flagellar basal body rod protein FlgC
MRIIAENLANADSTSKTPAATPTGARRRCSSRPRSPARRA